MMDAISQFASMFSGLGQAQAAAPVQQQVVAPTLVPAQQIVASPVVVPSGYVVAAGPPVAYRALALGWNTGGGWVVRASPTIAAASLDALQTCNGQFGGCVLSDYVVSPTAFGCLVLAQSADDPSHLFAAVGNTLDQARMSVDTQVTSAGTRGSFIYTGCNS